MEGALSPHPLGRGNKGHPPQAGTAGDAQTLWMGNDNPKYGNAGGCHPYTPPSWAALGDTLSGKVLPKHREHGEGGILR